MLPGIALTSRGTPTPHQRIAAALAYGGPDAVLTGVVACRLQGLRRPQERGDVHLLLPHPRRRLSTGFVTVERTERLPRPRPVAGFPLAPIARAVLDAARRMDDLDAIRAVLSEAVQTGRTTPRRLRAELEEGSGRGSARPRVVVGELEAGARSTPESWALGVVRRARDLPEPMWNPRLYVGGRFLASPDGWIDDVALAWEVQSFAHHGDPSAFDATMRRQALLVAAGIVVVPTTPRQLRDDPDQALANLRDGYVHAAARPRPAVRALPLAG